MAKIQLSEHFTYKKLLKFAIPSIFMMVFISIYSVVDGFFVSNFVGKTAFASVNFIMPYLMILGGIGFMIGSGGSALIGKTLGEKNNKKANQIFSMLIYFTIILGIAIGIFGIITLPQVASFLGATDSLLDLSIIYGKIILAGIPFMMLQCVFHAFCITAEKPKLGLYVTLFAGCLNMFLDFLFVGLLHFGVVGAAVATIVSQAFGGIIPFIYFARKNNSLLKLGNIYFNGSELTQTLINGSSEFVSNVSLSLVGMLYNIQLLKYSGENGVATFGVLMYVGMIFVAIFIGYSLGTAPIVSYHYGAENKPELKNLYNKSIKLMCISALIMFLLSEICANPLSQIFVGYNDELMTMTVHAFIIFGFSFPFTAIPIFGSSFFTALNNGPVSAAISLLRTAVIKVIVVLLLPKIFGLNGIWYSIVVAELGATIVTVVFLVIKKKKYGY